MSGTRAAADAPVLQYPLAAGPILTRVLECGVGGRPLVLLHGLGARADRWRPTLPVLAAAGWHCYAADLPGHGLAAKREAGELSVPAFARFLGDLLDVLEIERAVLVGTSLGGHVSATFACGAPERVRALSLVGAVGLYPIGREAGEAIRKSVRATDRAAIEQKLRFVIAPQELVTPELVAEEWRINNSPGAAQVFERLGDYIATELDRDAVGERLAALKGRVPLQLVWGALDRVVPPAVGTAASTLLGVPLELVPGAGHAPYMENPEVFERLLLDFLAKLAEESPEHGGGR